MKKFLFIMMMLMGFCHAAVIENVIARQRPGTGIVDIYYDLVINEGGTTTVSASVEGGEVRMVTLSGDIGVVMPGIGRHIVWNAQDDNPERVISEVRVVISASVMDIIEYQGMKRVCGTYRCSVQGDYYYDTSRVNENWTYTGDFYIDRAPVSGALWYKVVSWAVKHGYTFSNRTTYSLSSRVVYPDALDAWAWCNARSQMEGLPKCHKRNTWGDYSYGNDRTEQVYPERNGGYRLPFLHEMTAAFCAGVIRDSSGEGFAAHMSTGMENIGYVAALKNSDPADFRYCSASWGLKKPLYCVRDIKQGYPIIETFPSNYSNAFDIDTRMDSFDFPKDFKIIDIKSKYCDGKYGKGRKALFLSGVHVNCNVEFEVEVYGGDLIYLERINGEEIKFETGKFMLDVGALAPGDSFVVRARSSDGRWSQNFQLNFDIATQKGATWTAASGKDSIQYRTVELDSFQLFDQLNDDQADLADPFNAQQSHFIENLVAKFKKYPHQLQVGGNICWTMDSSDGIIRGVALLGVQSSTADNAATLTGKIAEVKARGGKQVLKFGNVSGYIKAGVENKWSWDARSLSWQEHGNYLAINVGANGCFFRNWIPTPIPWYYSADGGVDVYLRAAIADGGLRYAIDTDKLLYVTLRIGIGVPSVLSIEGSGTGSIFLTYDNETDPNLQRLGMALALALKAHMVGFTIPIWDWAGEWNWVGGNNEIADIDISDIIDKAMDGAVNGGNDINIVPRDYLDDYNAAGGVEGGYKWPGIQVVTKNPYPTSNTPIKICTNGIPNPTPLAPGDVPSPPIVTDNGNPVPEDGVDSSSPKKPVPKIVAVVDNPNRFPRTRATIITISDMTNTTFTAEDAVWDDGTPDYNPSAAMLTNGSSVVAWMNVKDGCNDDISLGEMLSAMEIAVAVWDNEANGWTHLNLTDNSAYDRSPVLKTATNGTAAVAWLRNAYTNYIGSASKPNQVCFARYAGGSWTAESVVVPSVGRVRKLDMAYDGNRAAIVFNEEDDPGNGTTQRLCVVTGDCMVWEPLRTVAEFPVNGSVAYAYYDEAGGLRLVWNDEGKIKTGLYSDGTLTAEMIDVDGHQVPSDYAFTRAHSGRMALVWLERMKEDDPTMGPVAMTYNPAYGMWTLPCALTWDDENKTEVSAAFNDAGDLEVIYATPNVTTNEQGIVETVSSGVSKVTRRHGGDVAILLEDVSFSTNVFTAGETIDVTFKVKNLGDEPVSNATFRVYDRSNGTQILRNIVCVAGLMDGQTITSSSLTRINELQVGQCLELRAPWTVPESASSQLYLYLASSASGDIMRQNNTASWMYGSTDISISYAQSRIDDLSPNVRHISVALENTGWTAAPTGTVVTFRRGTAEGTMLATKTVGNILSGDGIQETGFAWDVSSITPTSNVEVVHVTAVLPESVGNVAERTLEADVMVDVSPVVKSSLTAYSLRYAANGGEGAMADEQPFYDEWGTLASNTFTRAGYSFAGWALSPTGDVVYADGAVRWNIPMYSKDTATLYAVWTRITSTTSTDVPIPFSWLGAYFPEATNATEDLNEIAANFEAAALRMTGKRDGNGKALQVWQDYVAGTDPTNAASVFAARIEMIGDIPQITWSPDLNTNGVERIYTIWGKADLKDSVWHSPTNSSDRFFKVSVDMP